MVSPFEKMTLVAETRLIGIDVRRGKIVSLGLCKRQGERSRREKKAPAAEYQFCDVGSEHPGEGGEWEGKGGRADWRNIGNVVPSTVPPCHFWLLTIAGYTCRPER